MKILKEYRFTKPKEISYTKVIIYGSRTIVNYRILLDALKKSNFEITEILSGGARGVDTLAIRYAKENDIPYKIYKADWNKYGKSAGPIRNKEMINNADALIAIWDGKSRGTADIIRRARRKGIRVFVYTINRDDINRRGKPNETSHDTLHEK